MTFDVHSWLWSKLTWMTVLFPIFSIGHDIRLQYSENGIWHFSVFLVFSQATPRMFNWETAQWTNWTLWPSSVGPRPYSPSPATTVSKNQQQRTLIRQQWKGGSSCFLSYSGGRCPLFVGWIHIDGITCFLDFSVHDIHLGIKKSQKIIESDWLSQIILHDPRLSQIIPVDKEHHFRRVSSPGSSPVPVRFQFPSGGHGGANTSGLSSAGWGANWRLWFLGWPIFGRFT